MSTIERHTRLYLCSPTNSTMFTRCCNVAVNDNETVCPRCKATVDPPPGRYRWSTVYSEYGTKVRR